MFYPIIVIISLVGQFSEGKADQNSAGNYTIISRALAIEVNTLFEGLIKWQISYQYFIFKETKEYLMNKTEVKNKIVDSLKGQNEIEKIIIFGSFNKSESPNDIDIAVVQNSTDNYLTLALKYRKLIRIISKEIAIDIFPILEKNDNSFYSREIASGEVIYAKGN